MKNLFCRRASLYFPDKSEPNYNHFQPNERQDADISSKNGFRIILYSPISVYKGANIVFFSNVAPKTLILIFSEWAFSTFKLQNSTTRHRIELSGRFFLKCLSLPPLWNNIDILKLTFPTLGMFSQISSHI